MDTVIASLIKKYRLFFEWYNSFKSILNQIDGKIIKNKCVLSSILMMTNIFLLTQLAPGDL